MLRGLKSLHEEKGAIMYVVIALSFGLLLFVPVFIDYASLHYARRAAQKAADAAALAAAVEYADKFSIDTTFHWITLAIWPACCTCWTDKECVAVIYWTLWVLTWGNWDGLGRDIAKDYANRNGSQMTHYRAFCPGYWYLIPKLKFIGWFPILPPGIDVEVKRKVPMIYEALYGGEFYVTAKATAEPYLYDYEEGSSPCAGPCKPWVGVVTTFKFKWKVRLVE
jgi:hypothetical protein